MVVIDRLDNLQDIAGWSVWKKPVAPVPIDSCFKLEDIPGKGMGMVATRLIHAGELICAERPIVVTTRNVAVNGEETYNDGTFHRNCITGLSEKARAAILSLKNSFPPSSGLDMLPGMLKSNYLEVDMTERPDPERPYSGCFPILSRINHDCSPSANYFFAFEPYCGQLWAARDIPDGGEITIAYTTLPAPRVDRQAHLSERYFFTCTCVACSLPPIEAARSDTRRIGLSKLLARSSTRSGLISAAELQQGVKWAEDEGLAAIAAHAAYYGAGNLAMCGDGELALEWARRGRDACRMVEGEGSYNVRELEQLLALSPQDLRLLARLGRRP
ncbi:hypothetical protein CERSUDRAFT_91931 [Gelatoporia subvermispora B]|uniref:SET domain-containing protein n=1 Tax=Ceriporiopsis subvermispora (strain B) TaxID=914234 RepID=M2RRW6_CERS8|nr:hypothetical protein CERSUDRAFT_91931 [Gelatoporia subvermispora B]